MFGYRIPICTSMLKDNNGKYYPKRPYWFGKNDFNMEIISGKEEEFRKLAEELLESDFAKYMTLDHEISSIEEQSRPIIIPRSFQFDLRTEKSLFSYLGSEDILEFFSVKKSSEKWEPLTQQHLNYISKIEFPKSCFNDYHQRIIERSIEDDRQVVLCDSYKPEVHTKFKIQDDGKKLILSKTNK